MHSLQSWVSRGQSPRGSDSGGERQDSTAWLLAQGPALPPLPAQWGAQGEPGQMGCSGGNGSCRSCPQGGAKPPVNQHPHPRVAHLHPCAWAFKTSAACSVPVCAAHPQCKPLAEVLLSLFKQLSEYCSSLSDKGLGSEDFNHYSCRLELVQNVSFLGKALNKAGVKGILWYKSLNHLEVFLPADRTIVKM